MSNSVLALRASNAMPHTTPTRPGRGDSLRSTATLSRANALSTRRLPVLLRLSRVAALVATLLVVLVAPSSAVSSAQQCKSTGRLLRYVVLFDAGTSEQSAQQAVGSTCGTSIAFYPQIAVGIAVSAEPRFAARFGMARAYSAQAETVGNPGRAELSSPAVPSTAARLPA